MRIALISDLHASPIQLDRVLADIDVSRVDRILCLGDIVDLGPEPNEVIDRLIRRGVSCLGGNHDVLTGPPLAPPHVNAWCRARIGPVERAWLEALPSSVTIELPFGRRLLAVHGSPRSFDDEILPGTPEADLERWCGSDDFDVLAAGHTHIQMVRDFGAKTIVNPGSAALPFEAPYDPSRGPPRVLRAAEYAIVDAAEDLSIELRSLSYDFEVYARLVRESGLPDPEAWLRTFVGA